MDDLIILPLGILLAARLVPAPLMQEFRAEAERRQERPRSRAGIAAVIVTWLATAAFLIWLFWPEGAR